MNSFPWKKQEGQKETTLTCSKEDLDYILAFILKFAGDRNSGGIVNNCENSS